MTEAEYDEVVAPELLRIAELIETMGGSFVGRVEWKKHGAGITSIGVGPDSSAAQILTKLAALSKGNIDAILIEAIRRLDCSASMFLRSYCAAGVTNPPPPTGQARARR